MGGGEVGGRGRLRSGVQSFSEPVPLGWELISVSRAFSPPPLGGVGYFLSHCQLGLENTPAR